MRSLLVLLFVVGCSSGTRHTTVVTSVRAIDVAVALWAPFDVAHQKALVDASKSREEADGKLTVWRITEAKVNALFVTAYSLETVALSQNTSEATSAALAALVEVQSELRTLGVKL